MASRWAPTRSRRRARRWAGPHAPFEMPDGCRCALGRRATRARRARRRGTRASPPTAPRIRRWPPSSSAAWRGELPADFAQTRRRRAGRRSRQGRDAWPRARPSQNALDALAPQAARAARRQRRPDRLEPDRLPRLRRGARRRDGRPPHQLRRARVRHGRDHERHGAARRLHPLRRHLPDLQRLQPQRHPHGRADEAARDPRLHARLDRPGRGRPDAPDGRACAPACA